MINKNYIIVSGFSEKTPYEDEAKKLEESLKKIDLKYKIYPFKNQKSWHKNCQQKAIIIKNALEEFNTNVFWTDSDSIINKNPDLLESLNCDFACHFLKTSWNDNELLSGGIYFGNTPVAKKMIDRWISINNSNATMDQKNLQQVCEEMKGEIRFFLLPAEYVKIYNFDRWQGSNPPIITHFQASRRFKKQV